MKTKLEFDLWSEHLNGTGMTVTVSAPGYHRPSEMLPAGLTVVQCELTVPSQIQILVQGKGNRDTQLDRDGRIVADKHILLQDLRVDSMSVSPHWLPRFVRLQTDQGHTVHSNYWGFNGSVLFDIGPTAFQFVAGTYTR